MSKCIDLTGKVFGHLTVLSRAENYKNGRAKWLCQCDCGNTTVAISSNIMRGYTKSCGCCEGGYTNKRHGMTNTPLHRKWKSLKFRCYNPNSNAYMNYGGRGIKVCDEWLCETGFENFYKWAIESGYKDGMTIERIDVNGDYEPDNCTWADRKHQAWNRRNSIYVEHDGIRKSLPEWCYELNMPYGRIKGRYSRLLNKHITTSYELLFY